MVVGAGRVARAIAGLRVVAGLQWERGMAARKALLFASVSVAGALLISRSARAQDYGTVPGTTGVSGIPSPPAPPEPPPASPPKATAIDPSDLPDPPEHVSRTTWYGWETLLLDAGSLAMIVGGSSNNQSVLAAAGVGAYALGPPIVHAVRGHGEKAAVDIAVRLLAPTVLAFTGYAIGVATSPPCTPQEFICIPGAGGFVAGGLLGYAGAVVFDAAFLASDRAPARHDASAPAAVHWAPTVAVTQQGGSVGVGGVF